MCYFHSSIQQCHELLTIPMLEVQMEKNTCDGKFYSKKNIFNYVLLQLIAFYVDLLFHSYSIVQDSLQKLMSLMTLGKIH